MRPRQKALAALAFAAAAVSLAWFLFVGLPQWYSPSAARPEAPSSTPPPRRIKANLFYVAEGGTKLTTVEREVPFGENATEQAKAIINEQIAPVAAPLVSAIPPGTTLRALYITATGEAYVDLSRELVAAHPGGSMNELLTIYTLVDALVVNLPAVTVVQLLVDGKELDTLAGHVDLRRPLTKKLP